MWAGINNCRAVHSMFLPPVQYGIPLVLSIDLAKQRSLTTGNRKWRERIPLDLAYRVDVFGGDCVGIQVDIDVCYAAIACPYFYL